MLNESPYVDGAGIASGPLTDVPCRAAPQAGVHLYHFPLSLCSQKARQVLEEKGIQWESHVLMLPEYEQYDPAYVRINPRCVVPTLVRDGRVTTDSANILRFVDREFSQGPSLVPAGAEEKKCMEAFLRAADALFVEALTYGAVPGIARPLKMRLATRGHSDKQRAALTRQIEAHKDDPYLKNAYEAKLKIALSTHDAIDSRERMLEIFGLAERSMERLELQLADGPFARDGWLCSDTFSLADIEWGVVLNRFKWVGFADRLWGQRPRVARYAARLFARPAFEKGVTAWSNPLTKVIVPSLLKKVGARS